MVEPPSYTDVDGGHAIQDADLSGNYGLFQKSTTSAVCTPTILQGVNARWHYPLQICRALSTAPSAWWGLRCALTFLGELLFADNGGLMDGGEWDVEKRFRVTEVFLAILWVSGL